MTLARKHLHATVVTLCHGKVWRGVSIARSRGCMGGMDIGQVGVNIGRPGALGTTDCPHLTVVQFTAFQLYHRGKAICIL